MQSLKLFIAKYPSYGIHYSIVGDGYYIGELQALKDTATQLELNSFVSFYGRIPNTELAPYFDYCNVGVSFVPMTDCYDSQSVTKTFEYAMSGLIVIGTATSENRKVINGNNWGINKR